MSSAATKVSEHWSEYTERFSDGRSGLFWWEAGDALHKHTNAKISGDPQVSWLEYTLHKYFEDRVPLPRCLSLGCGSGRLERQLAQLNAFQECDAFDLAQGSIDSAKKLAKEKGFNHINYFLADVNTLILPPNQYDAVWIHNALHHFEALEHIYQQISHTLKPGGLLILNEYVGPSRFQFPARQKEITNLCFGLLPVRFRTVKQGTYQVELERSPTRQGLRWTVTRLADKIRDGDVLGLVQRRLRTYQARQRGQGLQRNSITFPSTRDVVAADPSEAVRSGEIIELLERYFEILEKKGRGGNILQFLLAGISTNFSDAKESESLLKMLFAIEDTLLDCGELKDDMAFIVARPLDR